MNAAIAVQLAGYAVALAFGVFAIGGWRRAGSPVRAGLALAIDHRTAIDIVAGLSITTAAMVGIMLLERAAGGIRVSQAAFDVAGAVQFGLFLVLDAFIEEFMMRGMLVSGLSRLLGGRALAAVLIAGVLFGMTHMFFDGASVLSVISNSLGGVIYGLAFILTGRIWLVLGLHFAWNYVQGPILGFTVSGHALGGGLFHIVDLGPAWLTGTPYGPEGGVIGIAFRFVIIAAVLAWVRTARRA
jgi:membrane protease YdiL (CAAX protease family)